MSNKKRITITIDYDIYLIAKNICFWDNRSLSNLLETTVLWYNNRYFSERVKEKES